MRPGLAPLLVSTALVMGLAGCGGARASGSAGAAAAPRPAPATSDVAADGCPVAAADLSSATGMTWTERTTQTGRELETLPGVTADVCILTTDDRPQAGGDPLVLRTDTAVGDAAGSLRTEFAVSCRRNGGTTDASGAATTCRNPALPPDGLLDRGDRVVHVYYADADKATATELTGSFGKVLATVR